jgi:hypothetical protein
MKKFPRQVVVEQIAALVAAISHETLEDVQGGVAMHMAYGVPSPTYDDLEPKHTRPRWRARLRQEDETERKQVEPGSDQTITQ